ncbi:selenide, water dikinase SelD [Pseudobacteriovorax antillogorgiicola]|uniref:Selenophosphate synthase n=1 Tax=Pseudobacteriovorax antillogorgiicola TaxID=1513793 RepID=A0A1Y6CHI6_9BACT|nr:selenide, water dikinase SelD [Pseudobacteriovorax antillogorgiicola]TCS47299.1 selenophosphate synthase [Pseudobacteriovorax antillogorgiicola]SMF62482.1 selenophosphate synthase [Pseudobacteriovorax antillogorgiicola]
MRVMNHPYRVDLVLLGGGHSHGIFLKMWGMNPVDGVRVTLISESTDTPYSGMLPGFIGGIYSHEEAHIDLRQLTEYAGVRYIHGHVEGLDIPARQIKLADRPPVRFDCLSFNLGSRPQMDDVEGAHEFGIGIKPVARFWEYWSHVQETVKRHGPHTLSVVGAGAAGVETAISMKRACPQLKIQLIQKSSEILPAHHPKVRKIMADKLLAAGVDVICDAAVKSLKKGNIILQSGPPLETDFTVFTTQAGAPQWLAESGLKLDERGFIAVRDTLQSASHPFIFAVGDVATMEDHPRPKSGVFAVRQGQPLFHHVSQYLKGQKPSQFYPQKRFLSLMYTGDGAVLSRGGLAFSHPVLARYKDHIDRKFMKKFQNLELREMRTQIGIVERSDEFEETIRCHGCAAKVGSRILHGALERLKKEPWKPKADFALHHDDAAILDIPSDTRLLQTVDHLTAFVSDPYIFGRIAANHCLSDIYAMGGKPHSALANIIVPYADQRIMEEDIYQTLEGMMTSLESSKTALLGGHTSEGQHLSLSLTVNGLMPPSGALAKTSVKAGHKLILTKALGTGVLLAAAMRIKARGVWIDHGISSMIMDNGAAAACFVKHRASACTDVTGFGLIGHLQEMLISENLGAKLFRDAIPVLAGALEVSERGIVSSLFAQNRAFLDSLSYRDQDPKAKILVDPQTSGGLLAAIPAETADQCLVDLRAAGYLDASIIGQLEPLGTAQPMELI